MASLGSSNRPAPPIATDIYNRITGKSAENWTCGARPRAPKKVAACPNDRRFYKGIDRIVGDVEAFAPQSQIFIQTTRALATKP